MIANSAEAREWRKRQLTDRASVDYPWVGADLDSQTKYRLAMSKEFDLTYDEVDEVLCGLSWPS